VTLDSASELFCDYCGLPVAGGRRHRDARAASAEPAYCCSGCRFAASVLASDGGDAPRHTLLKLGLGVFFAMNVMVFSMALWTRDLYGEELGVSEPLADALHEVFRYLAMIFCLPVVLLLGEPLAIGVWQALRRRVVTTDLLLIIGVSAAIGYSLWSVVTGSGQIYFDVATMILVFLTLGRWFEAQGKLRSGLVLDALEKLLPDEVHVVRGNVVVDLPRADAVAGDRLRVFPGERFAVDGLITSGSGDIDEQVVTGESRPVFRELGEAVCSGTLNLDGDLEIKVTAAAGAETVSRMLDLVRKARRARGHYQRLADRITFWFVPAVAVVALATAWWHGRQSGLDAGILSGLAVALIACPCALGLATPLAIWIALGRAARGQVLFRNGQALEQLAGVRAMLFDKTGTLTTGGTGVTSFVSHEAVDAEHLLGVAGQLAAASNHCFSLAIQTYARGYERDCEIDDIKTIPGKGIQARVRGGSEASPGDDRALLGSAQWLQREGFVMPKSLWHDVEEKGGRDAPLACVGWGGQVRGVFVFREQLRAEAAAALGHCRRLGIHVAVATGDRTPRATKLADLLQVPVFAEQLPEDKVAVLQDARRRFGSCAMVGDGINDAPALAASDVGIALGCGADLSRDSAAVCLLSDELMHLPWAIELARQTVRIIRQNLCWAFSYNVVGIGLAASGRLNPVFAAAAMVASSVFVIANSLRLGHFPEALIAEDAAEMVSEPHLPPVIDPPADSFNVTPASSRAAADALQATAP
jgi:heavy metal translocating P-type ATPase